MSAGPGGGQTRHRFEGFRYLLEANSELLELMADLEADLRHVPLGELRVRGPLLRLLDGTLLLAETLNVLTDDRFADLYAAHARIDAAVRRLLRESLQPEAPLVLPLAEVGAADAPRVGGKAANLAAVRAALPELVPDGFVVTTEAYWRVLRQGDVLHRLRELMGEMEVLTDHVLFGERTRAARELVESIAVPADVAAAIRTAAAVLPARSPRWAVRSSAVGEDGAMSFAGQFESVLGVTRDRLVDAYHRVLVGRFSDRAVMFRLLAGLTEVATPMAVLVMPMLEPRSAGVAYTRDPREPGRDLMLVNATWGLADRMVAGRAPADTFLLRRAPAGEPVTVHVATKESGDARAEQPSLTPEELARLARIALGVEGAFGAPQDIEWVLDASGRFWVVQSRPLAVVDAAAPRRERRRLPEPLLRGGVTVAPGRAVGAIHHMSAPADTAPPEGAILVVDQAVPELGTVLPRLAGLIAEQGSPAGHLAALLRELGIPSLFGVAGARRDLEPGQQVGLDATGRAVYPGTPWPEVRERVEARLHRVRQQHSSHPLDELVIRLDLVDPMASSFRPSRCRSLHDIIRFCHEKAVAALFDASDREVERERQRPLALLTGLPLDFVIIDLGGPVAPAARDAGRVEPDDVRSVPFRAMWDGIVTPGVRWAGRTGVSFQGFASVLMAQQDRTGPRAMGDRNYILVAPRYLNLNARLAYHFAMVDSWVEDAAENNFVNFRFRGGGAGPGRRDLRARFLAEVLLNAGFGVDRREDLVTAWLRRHSREQSEDGLRLLGRLMGCARQLDMVLDDERGVRAWVDRFLAGEYEAFG